MAYGLTDFLDFVLTSIEHVTISHINKQHDILYIISES